MHPGKTDIKEIERISKKVMKDYNKTFKDLAKYDNEDEPIIETYQQESQAIKYLFFGFLILVAVGFIIGNCYLRTL